MKTMLIALLVLVGLATRVYAQETFSKQFRLRKLKVWKKSDSLIVKRDTTFLRADMLPDRFIEKQAADQKERELSFIIGDKFFDLIRGTFSSSKDRITIAAGAMLHVHDVVRLRKEVEVSFSSLSSAEKSKIKLPYKLGDTLNYTIEGTVPSGKVTRTRRVVVDDAFFSALKVKKEVFADTLPATMGYVKFEDDKIWVNPNLENFESKGLYYYKLSNRQTMRLNFNDVTVSALTIPLKYRPKKSGEGLKAVSEEFTTAININAFVGGTVWGKTSFHYREKVGNISNTVKVTLGGIIGASTVTLNKSNTSASDSPILDDTEITKGLLSLGVGGVGSFNKINVGVFLGWDRSMGTDAARWNYNKRPWFGLAFGYSLVPF
jgi:hypothetical protein